MTKQKGCASQPSAEYCAHHPFRHRSRCERVCGDAGAMHSQRRRLPILVMGFSLVIFLIIDLDRPSAGS
jgi:hypothetical protein